MAQPSPVVPVTVSSLSGREVVVYMLPSSSVLELQEEAERALGVDFLHEVLLSDVNSKELLHHSLSIAQLARQREGDAAHVTAVTVKSVRKARAALQIKEARIALNNDKCSDGPMQWSKQITKFSAVAEKYTPALELLIELDDSSDVPWPMPGQPLPGLRGQVWGIFVMCPKSPQDPVHSRFVALANLFRCTRDRNGTQKYFLALDFELCGASSSTKWSTGTLHEVFNEFAINRIRDAANFKTEIKAVWPDENYHNDGPFQLWRVAQRHPQAAVREAARDAERAEVARGCEPSAGAAAAEPSEPSAEQERAKLAEALQRSDQEALEREAEEVTKAVLLSKADRWSADDVILARLNMYTPELLEMLGSSSVLEPCLRRVADAGCEPRPSWARGALLLVPATEEQIAEAGISLKQHHILMLSADRALVEEVLKSVPKRRRPKVWAEHSAEGAHDPRKAACDECGASHGLSPGTCEYVGKLYCQPCWDLWKRGARDGSDSRPGAPLGHWMCEVGLVVENSFLHLPICKEVSETSTFVQSAPPACIGEASQPSNPRRWRLGVGSP